MSQKNIKKARLPRRGVAGRSLSKQEMPGVGTLGRATRISSQGMIPIDPYRSVIFPNAIREQRRRAGGDSLLALSTLLPHIPYIRLSKIERGEVVANVNELRDIAACLGIDPTSLLTDVENPEFSVALWSSMRGEALRINDEGEELAMLLAAAFRARRAGDKLLTLAALQSDYGLPPVIVSRIENAAKTPDKWNAATMAAICKLLGANHPRKLMATLYESHANGELDEWLKRIPGADDRIAQTRAIIAQLRKDLENQPDTRDTSVTGNRIPPKTSQSDTAPLQSGEHMMGLLRLPVRGTPMDDGLIDLTTSNGDVVAPANSGPNSYALHMCRPTLGAALPGQAVLIVDPDRFPSNGGLAVLREGEGHRVITITSDKDGRMIGHSLNPEKEIPLDATPPVDLAMVTAVLLG